MSEAIKWLKLLRAHEKYNTIFNPLNRNIVPQLTKAIAEVEGLYDKINKRKGGPCCLCKRHTTHTEQILKTGVDWVTRLRFTKKDFYTAFTCLRCANDMQEV